jgi:hypothetical protein
MVIKVIRVSHSMKGGIFQRFQADIHLRRHILRL